MRASLDDFTAFQHNDFIAVSDGAKPVSHHNTGATTPSQVSINSNFCFSI
jgi:hypothetical protein